MPYETRRDGYLISDDPARIDVDAVVAFMHNQSYWATNRPRAVIEQSLRHSLCCGLYAEDKPGAPQVGLARVLTDYATIAYMADVYVLPEHRGKGLGVWLVEQTIAHPALEGIPRWLLITRDAHTLYEKVGFGPLPKPKNVMVRE